MIRRMNLIDIIKGIMIIFIIITHFQFAFPEDYKKYGFFYYVDMAVPVFMIISGYLASLSLEKNKIEDIKKHYLRYILYPNY